MDTATALKRALLELKNRTLAKNQVFSEAFEYFFDHLIDTELLLNQGHFLEDQKRLDFFNAMLMPILSRFAIRPDVKLLLLREIPEGEFVHGSAFLSDQNSIMLYFFDDIKMGMATTSLSPGNTHYFRISAGFIKRPEGLKENGMTSIVLPLDASRNVH